MSSNAYVAPHLRNKQVTTEQPTTMDRRNPFQKDRRAPRRPHEKPFWQIEQEKAKLEVEEKKKAAERGLEDTEENFPVLHGSSGTVQTGSIWSGGRKFSELATEWRSTDDQRKEEEERQKNCVDDNTREDGFQLPRFRSMRRFSEPEDECCEDEAPCEQPLPEEEKWTFVEHRKYRKPKKEFDFNEEPDDYEENGEDETVWGAPEEHETCWDERR